ncbi:phosphonate C-P lyase system protein PhnG [Pseudooceanicola algae]|uniref:Alpha-D-ribose 1-methylphosphonate 5-triphosphate synthase subunit PhnG n=1 Tax=Pseudooceanicola algae TaxID=1537215 RepID=A0A418SC92_9RHOB|nr:phosphonate C-P lyase system protein PhnG [Pseudooceanicola algae]QPM90025.1 Alpha-D-ribose 1-methylphosphonate 5-triphosphate synthase subunit PhnG [Pseudooceanicola algae]
MAKDAVEEDRGSPDRRGWMSLLAKAPASEVTRLWAAVLPALDGEPEFAWLRSPEIGGVMLRGRAGGTGTAFNLGEMTVTRCALRLVSGEVGHAVVQGRARDKARIAALVDALMQGDRADLLRAVLLTPLREGMAARAAGRAARAEQTKVDFFTMVRGED